MFVWNRDVGLQHTCLVEIEFLCWKIHVRLKQICCVTIDSLLLWLVMRAVFDILGSSLCFDLHLWIKWFSGTSLDRGKVKMWLHTHQKLSYLLISMIILLYYDFGVITLLKKLGLFRVWYMKVAFYLSLILKVLFWKSWRKNNRSIICIKLHKLYVSLFIVRILLIWLDDQLNIMIRWLLFGSSVHSWYIDIWVCSKTNWQMTWRDKEQSSLSSLRSYTP